MCHIILKHLVTDPWNIRESQYQINTILSQFHDNCSKIHRKNISVYVHYLKIAAYEYMISIISSSSFSLKFETNLHFFNISLVRDCPGVYTL